MKKRIFLLSLLAALCVLAFAALPVSAADNFVYDQSGTLTLDEWQALESRAEQVSRDYDCGVYIVLVYDYRAYTSGFSIESAAQSIYKDNGFGVGDAQSGVLLLLSMMERDYDIAAYGYGNEAFTDYGKEVLAEKFLDNFRRDDWYGGLSDYIEASGDMLRQAREGNPLDVSNDQVHAAARNLREEFGAPGLLIVIVGIPCLIAFIACGAMKRKMKSVGKARSAWPYAVPNSLDIYESSDVFTHVTETRVKIESDSDRGGGGGGGTSVNSDGFSHSSGKF